MTAKVNKQRRIVAYLDGLQAKVNAFPLAAKRLGDNVREVQVKGGEELRPFFGRTLTSSPNEVSGMPSVLDRAFKGEL
jgi:hypothetical protein